ncbi:copper resistance CopC family protein [Candidatus Frankia nodulisporulans]|uniref:copper resistance CopC family protein n=1 Tax=Candidatus Frankia nodulisporulans TaxID=2060052 RepID=UPI0013D32810|nr:copper resistance CopC family protein [Candidatus Frankia nodulisporulans]
MRRQGQVRAGSRHRERARAPIGRVVACLLVALPALVIGLAAPASAHSRLVSTSPAADATVADPPTEVTLTFSESISSRYTRVAVTGPDGAPHTDGALRVQGGTVHQPLTATSNGVYTVSYQAVSADGHPIGGTFTFTVTQAATPTPTTPPDATPPTTTSPGASTVTVSPTATATDASASAVPTPATTADDPDDGGGIGGWGIAGLGVLAVAVVGGALYFVRRRRRPGEH